MKINLIAFDADDTLWHNEYLYRKARVEFLHLFAPLSNNESLGKYLDDLEIKNLEWYGYGIKSFALSMLQSAAEFLGDKLSGKQVMEIFAIVDSMFQAEVLLLDSVRWCLGLLHNKYPLLLLTKGDLFEQERKIKRSGIQEFFQYFEVVGDKTRKSYQDILAKYNCPSENFLMIGNSLRSDILPVLQIGGRAVYIPYQQTWSHEEVDRDELSKYHYESIKLLSELPSLVENLSNTP